MFDRVTVSLCSSLWYIKVNELLLYAMLMAYEFITLEQMHFTTVTFHWMQLGAGYGSEGLS